MQLSNSLVPRSSASSGYLLRQHGGAAAAYSLQRLDTSTENVVRVRESVGDTEADFTAEEVSGGALREFALQNDADLIRFANQATAADKRMYFDGSDDFIEVTGMTASVDYFGACTIQATLFVLDTSTTQMVWALGSGAYRMFIQSGAWYVGTNSTGVSVSAGKYTVAVDYDSSGNATELRIDGNTKWTGSEGGVGAGTSFYVGKRSTGNPFKGLIYDFSLSGSSVKNFSFNGYGNTNADWEDQVGSNDGTVNGSPALFSGQGFDAYVTTLYDQSGNGRNATQATAASQPQIVADGVVVTDGNGNPAMTHQTAGSGIGLSFPIAARNTYWETFVTYQSEASETRGCLLSDSDNASGIWGIVQDGAGSVPSANVTGAIYRKNGTALSSPTRDDMHTQFHDGSINLMTAYGTHDDSTVWDGSDITYFKYGGSPTEFSPVCVFGEIIIYKTSQSSNRAAIEANIASRYGITLA